MKTIILTGRGLEHRYVMKSLMEVLDDYLCGILIESKPKREVRLSSFKRFRGRYTYARMVERVITKLTRKILKFDGRQEAALKGVLGSDPVKIPSNLSLIEGESVNSQESIQWIRGIRPDFIFVYGTNIVGNEVLSLASVKALNLHTGLSPFYRGSDSFFWALYNKEPEMVGATVHECTSSVDGGNIYARGSVRLKERDDPFLAFARSVKLGALIYSNVARFLASGESLSNEKQDLSLGEEYCFANRTFWHDMKMEYMVRSGQLKRLIKDSFNKALLFPYTDSTC